MSRTSVLFFALVTASSALYAQQFVFADGKATAGYRLVAPLNSQEAWLVDGNGETVHRWTSSYPLSSVAYLLPNGNLLRTAAVDDRSIRTGGAGGRVEELAWDGTVVWSFQISDSNYVLHHDVRKLPNGNYLMLLWERKSRLETIDAGGIPERISPAGYLNERIIEVRPNYPDGGDIVWQWNLWDHLVQNVDPEKQNYGDIAENWDRVDINFTADPTNDDPFHFNSVDYSPEFDQILISNRNFSEVWIIDHSTTTEEASTSNGGRSAKGGRLLYRWGNPQAWAGGQPSDQKISGQHNAHWIPPGLPGAGNVLLFNNITPGFDFSSSVFELTLPADSTGFYDLTDKFQPAAPTWSYLSTEPRAFYSAFISGAQRLPNGNTLICSGAQANIFEVTPDGEIVWLYFAGQTGGRPVNVFRSYWYPHDFEGLRNTPLYVE